MSYSLEFSVTGLLGIALSLIGGGIVKVFPNIDWVGWPILGIGILLLIECFRRLVYDKLRWHLYPTWSFTLPSLFPFRILIPLDKAAQIAYEKLRGTPLGCLAKRFSSNAGLDYFVSELAGGCAPLYGSHHPSTRMEIVKLGDDGTLSDDGSKTIADDGTPICINLMIERGRFHEYIKAKKEKPF